MSKYVPRDWNKITEKQKTNTTAAASECVNNLKAAVDAGGNPCKLAASDASLKKAQASINDAFLKGRQKKQLLAVTNEEFKDSLDAGAIIAGVNNSKKIGEFNNKYGPISDGITKTVNAMPNSTPSERDAKVMANLRLRREKKYKDM
jgi:hypothetical protein